METRQLEYFLAVARTNNVTQAARQLHLTQPTLSRQIHDLEAEVGVELFDRDRHHLQLNAAGKLFADRAELVLATLERAKQAVQADPTALRGTINIGCVETAASAWLAQRLATFTTAHPQVNFQLYDGDGDSLRARLDNGQDDLAILVEPVEARKYNYLPLAVQDQWGLIVNEHHPLATQTSVDLATLADLPLIMGRRSIVQTDLTDQLGLNPRQLNIRVTINLPFTGLQLVRQSQLAFLSLRSVYEQFDHPGLVYVPLAPATTTSHLVAWSKPQALTPAATAFLQSLTEKIS